MNVRSDKCLHTWEFKTAMRDVATSRLRPLWRYWTPQLAKAWALKDRCLPTTIPGIIAYVFAGHNPELAKRVAGCESTGSPYSWYRWAKNPRSTASGPWQLLDIHWRGNFDPFDVWASTRYAFRLSYSGSNFYHAWYASAGCWS